MANHSNTSKTLESSNPTVKPPIILRSTSFAEQFDAFKLPGSMNEPVTTYKSGYYEPSWQFPYNPDKLTQGNTYKIYDEMRDDDQIKACVSFKKDICVGSGWRINCEDKEVKEFVETNLKEKLDEYELGKSFDDVLRDMLSAFEYGFSIAEPVYRINEEGLYEIKSVKVRAPHTFKFNLDRYGNILTITQSTDREEIDIDPTQFIHHVYQQEYGNPYGKSDLKSAHSAWASKKFFVRFYAMYVERFACPPVIGRYNPNMDANEVQRYYSVLKSLQNSSTFVIPEDTTLEFPMPNRDSTDSYIKGLDMFNMWIARSLLVPDLLGISGSKVGGGSYSLGQTQYKLFINTVEKERLNLARKITVRLVRPLVNANFGDVDASFEFLPITQEDELEYSKVWSDFMKSRLITPSEEEVNHFRKSLKYPEGPVEIQQPQLNPLSSQTKPGEEGEEENAPIPPQKQGQERKAEEEEEPEEKQMAIHFRQKTKYEAKIDFAQVHSQLEKGTNTFERNLRPLFNLVVKDLINQVKEKGIIKHFDPDQVNQIQPKYLRDLNTLMREGMTKIFVTSYNTAQKEFFPSAEKKFTDAEILPEEFIKIIESDAFKSVGDYSMLITKETKNKIMSALKNGVSEAELVRLLKEDLVSISENWLATFSRTKTTEMYNAARKTYYETDPVASNVVEAYQWSAIMDDRTSEICEYLDGKIFERGGEVDRLGPPAHFNCRSILVPITKYEDYSLDNMPSVDKLQGMGGNLIFSKAEKIFELHRSPNVLNVNITSLGEISLIQSMGYRIQVKRVTLSNASTKAPVSVGIGDRVYVTLPNLGGNFKIEFDKERSWILPQGLDLVSSITSNFAEPPNVDLVIEYILLDPQGYRA